MKITQPIRQIYKARVFFDANNRGNRALCVLLDGEPDLHAIACALDPEITYCFSWRRDQRVHVRCYRGGRAIEFCGHGLLASVHAWKAHLALAPAEMQLLSFRTAGQTYRVRAKNEAPWLSVPRLRCRNAKIPSDIKNYFNAMPNAMALAAGGSGYQIFQFESGTDIATVRVNLERLRLDKCATIITQAPASQLLQREQMAGSEWSFTLRYFAPQFGVDEDVATGSANVVLADYWRQRGLLPPFRARQCSPAGGIIESDIEADGKTILLGGHVSITAVQDDAGLAG